MDQQGATTKVGDAVSDLAAKTEKVVQDKIDQGMPVFRDLQANAGAAIEKAAGLARDASSAAKICCIPREEGRSRKPGDRRKRAAPGDPLPARFGSGHTDRSSEPERDEHQQDRPPGDFQQQTGPAWKRQIIEYDRESDDSRERDQQKSNGCDGEG